MLTCESNGAMTCWLDFTEASATPCGRLPVVTKVEYTLSSQKASSSLRNEHQLTELHPKVLVRVQYCQQMVATFVVKVAHVTTVALVTQRTVPVDWYIDHCLPPVLHTVAHGRPRALHRDLHHGNAPAHKAKRTPDFLAQRRLQQLRDPPYSPELAPCNFSPSLR